jgi:hypothetical protein
MVVVVFSAVAVFHLIQENKNIAHLISTGSTSLDKILMNSTGIIESTLPLLSLRDTTSNTLNPNSTGSGMAFGFKGGEEETVYFNYTYSIDELRVKFPKVPEWLDTFLSSQPVATHHDTLNDPEAKFIVMICHKLKGTVHEACGGLSDRLMRLPYYAWLAHKTGRKLLLYWSTPAPIEDFFDVASDQFDWRIPSGFATEELERYANRSFNEYKAQRRIVWHHHIESPIHNRTKFIFANSNLAKIPNEPDFLNGLQKHDVMGAIFHRLFKPSAKLMEQLNIIYSQNPGLIPGHYAAMHVRAKWPSGGIKTNKRHADAYGGGLNMNNDDNKKLVESIADNAAYCAKKAMPETKYIYVCSDSDEIATYLIHQSPMWSINATSEKNQHVRIIARTNYTEEPMHLNNHGYPSDKYMGVFVDLWMMAFSSCLSQGLGGFGHFGSELSGNHLTCRVRHRNYGSRVLHECPRPGKEMQDLKKKLLEEEQHAAESAVKSR